MSDDQRPPEPGKLTKHGTYVIDHGDPHYSPWQISAERPAGWRVAWRVLRGVYEPRVRIGISLTLKGTDRLLRGIWTSPSLEKELYSPRLPFLDG